ncbi:hypothetical protein ACFW9D_04130 [Streptomyces sp. NPDC059524]|uniref:hypothetical protein n=1 Tax=Streptomyces sp. NPDC059524 TaxID=3346856 RepID=UPI00368DC780
MTEQAPALSTEHDRLCRELGSIAVDYPSGDPVETLGRLVADADAALARQGTEQGRFERSGYLVLLYAMSWYVEARLSDQEDLIRAYEGVLRGFRQTFAESPACTCPDGGHPAPPEPEGAAELGVHLLTEDGRALYAEEEEPEEGLSVYDCELYLSGLARSAAY